MTTLYKQPGDGAILCEDCLTDHDRLFAVELDPALFPETYERLHCACCGTPGKAGQIRDRAARTLKIG